MILPDRTPDPSIPANKPKVAYIDFLKVVLTLLVIIHHAAVTYGAPGGWYYSQKTGNLWVSLSLTALVAVNQSFFMGFFFFLSAFFIPTSYDKKGPVKFLKDKLIRLGLPLLFYSFVLSPFLSFMPYNYTGAHPKITYLQYLGGFDTWISFGVLWFVAALLIFTLAYVVYRLLANELTDVVPAPGTLTIVLFAAAVGVVSYFVRLVYPVGRVLEPLGFQLGHFPQYMALFITGIIASRSGWLEKINLSTGRQLRLLAICLVLIGFPLFFAVQQWLRFPVEQFNIGGHWPSFWYAVWEQLTGFSIVSALLIIFRSSRYESNAFIAKVSRATFAMYIFHPLVLIAITVAMHGWGIEPGLKFVIAAPLALAGTYLLASRLIKIPFINAVL